MDFQFKLFDTAVTLKYNPGHWKWYEWVKLNDRKTIMQSLTFIIIIYSLRKNHNIKVFDTFGHLVGRTAHYPTGLTLIITQAHIFHASQKAFL